MVNLTSFTIVTNEYLKMPQSCTAVGLRMHSLVNDVKLTVPRWWTHLRAWSGRMGRLYRLYTEKRKKYIYFLYSFSSSHGSKAHPHRHSLSDWLLRSWGPAQGYGPAPSSWVWRYSGPALQSFVRSGVCVGRGAGGHSLRWYRIRSDPGHSSFSQAENGNGTREALWSRSPPPPIGRNHGSLQPIAGLLGGAWRGALHGAPRAVGGAVRHVFLLFAGAGSAAEEAGWREAEPSRQLSRRIGFCAHCGSRHHCWRMAAAYGGPRGTCSLRLPAFRLCPGV